MRLFYGFAGIFFLAAGASELIGITENEFLVAVELCLGIFFLGWGLLQPAVKRHFGRLHVTLNDAGIRWKLHQLTPPRFLAWEAIESFEWAATKVRLTDRDSRTHRIPHPDSPQKAEQLHEELSLYVERHGIPFEQWND